MSKFHRLEAHSVVHVHPRNQGYGANQKTYYKLALKQSGDVIIMVHPDYQYTPQLIPAMVTMIGSLFSGGNVMQKARLLSFLFVTVFFLAVIFRENAFAYLDPASGSYILQLLLAFLFGALFAIKIFWHKIRTFFSGLFSKK